MILFQFLSFNLSFHIWQTYETKKKGVGKVEEKQAVLHEEGKMDDGLEFSRSQKEESRTAQVIRKCDSLFSRFIRCAVLTILGYLCSHQLIKLYLCYIWAC